ncbi:hypothetical protein TNCV_3215981 [Trichonephila clavipes]|nr:hypothetical protein TNCV_3215981 [Trichonephila clavipes]
MSDSSDQMVFSPTNFEQVAACEKLRDIQLQVSQPFICRFTGWTDVHPGLIPIDSGHDQEKRGNVHDLTLESSYHPPIKDHFHCQRLCTIIGPPLSPSHALTLQASKFSNQNIGIPDRGKKSLAQPRFPVLKSSVNHPPAFILWYS